MLVPEARSGCIPCGAGIFSQFEALERILDAVRDAVFLPLPPSLRATVLQPTQRGPTRRICRCQADQYLPVLQAGTVKVHRPLATISDFAGSVMLTAAEALQGICSGLSSATWSVEKFQKMLAGSRTTPGTS